MEIAFDPAAHTPLERFVRQYVELTGGDWDEVEPQVYDVLIPAGKERDLVRIAFDPEAIPEHPGSQLASYGTPLIDRMLADALQRGRHARLYFIGLNLTPHDLTGRVRRALTLPADLSLRLERSRPMHFTQAVFWFQATFVSDQKEQEIVPVAMDLHYNRHVRHLDELFDESRLAESPSVYLPEARRCSLAAAYPLARERVAGILAPMINTRSRELGERLEKQTARVTRYYADLRGEVEEQEQRARGREEDPARFAARREALDREERLRIAELRAKSALQIELRLLNLLEVQQPKLLLRGSAVSASRKVHAVPDLVWNPLTESLEAVPCPMCGRPTLALALNRLGQLVCPDCAAEAGPARHSHRH
jgi:hypothetical protein